MYFQQITEHVVPGKRLGRNIKHDPRSLRYLYPAQRVDGLKSVRHLRRIPVLDQGDLGSCFPPGTRVRMADGGERAIEDVRLGEYVVTAEGNIGRVLRTMIRDEDGGLLRLVLWGHSHLRLTREHPVLTARGYVPAAELRIGDEVALPRFPEMSVAPRRLARRQFDEAVMVGAATYAVPRGARLEAPRRRRVRWTLSMAVGAGCRREGDRHVWRKVREIHAENYAGPVHNLSVEGDESYVAEGVGVHNCTGNAAEGACGTAMLYDAIPASLATKPCGDAATDERQAVALYSAATQLDAYEDNYPPTDTGSNGLSVAKAATRAGLISGYTHCTSLESALTALSQQPVITGINWYDSFDRTDANGLIKIGRHASVRGGHEIVLDELDVEGRRVGLTNSWGATWGLDGRAYISWDDFERLLSEKGDVTVFTPLSQPAPTPAPDPAG